ncbi:sigma-70 family RNA polymerase sigma factor [Stenotrophomonas sp. 278]|uniref:RNA polymerase sigma factor n=1 Tax=Stenotrophomonas sp. 278 TaxID=2479851 RepID=UPI000F677407|nr:sigma-70 family RNA polymerase sigma factor [Stenotrophomonas sp. 278]RRU08250.1 sigma-70 family RNA polymerase sigma factor [Stenotrophomonas sp. 278]
MNDSTAGTVDLRDYLLGTYDELKRRLVRRLGSDDLAGDALQDTWMRLDARRDRLDPVQNPAAYLLRMAMNTVVDRQRADHRLMQLDEVSALMELADPAPGPAQNAENDFAVQDMLALLQRMPERRRRILLAIRVEGLQQRDVAERLGVSLRLVQRELKAAQEYLAARSADGRPVRF